MKNELGKRILLEDIIKDIKGNKKYGHEWGRVCNSIQKVIDEYKIETIEQLQGRTIDIFVRKRSAGKATNKKIIEILQQYGVSLNAKGEFFFNGKYSYSIDTINRQLAENIENLRRARAEYIAATNRMKDFIEILAEKLEDIKTSITPEQAEDFLNKNREILTEIGVYSNVNINQLVEDVKKRKDVMKELKAIQQIAQKELKDSGIEGVDR